MTVIRTPLTEGILTCLICRAPADDLDHVRNRGMGGSKARDVPQNKVPLCRTHHTAKTMNVLKTEVVEDEHGLCYHWGRDLSVLAVHIPVAVSARYGCLVPIGEASGRTLETPPASPMAAEAPFSLADWREQGEWLIEEGLKLKGEVDGWRWRVGDWINQGTESIGEEAYGYIQELEAKFHIEALRQYAWVAECWPERYRVTDASYSLHRALARKARQSPQDAQQALVEAQAEGHTTEEVRAALSEPRTPLMYRCPECSYRGERERFKEERDA